MTGLTYVPRMTGTGAELNEHADVMTVVMDDMEGSAWQLRWDGRWYRAGVPWHGGPSELRDESVYVILNMPHGRGQHRNHAAKPWHFPYQEGTGRHRETYATFERRSDAYGRPAYYGELVRNK